MRRNLRLALVATLAMLLGIACSDSSPPPASPTQGPAAPAPGTPGPTSSATAVAMPEGGKLTLGAPAQVPAGVIVYYWGKTVPPEGTPQYPRRAYRTDSGELHVEDLRRNLPQDGDLYTMAIEADSGRLAMGICLRGYCGGYSEATPDAENVLYLSIDAGASWSAAGSLPPNSQVIGFNGPDLVVRTLAIAGDGTRSPARIWLFPSGRTIHGPPGTHPLVFQGEGLVWEHDLGPRNEYLATDGRVLWAAAQLPPSVEGGVMRTPGVSVWHGAASNPTPSWVVEQQQDGTVLRLASAEEVSSLGVVGRLPAGLLLGRVSPRYGESSIVTIDMGSGVVRTLSELLGPGDEHAFPITATLRSFMLVTTGEDCLNVRSSPHLASERLACVSDGSPLWVTGTIERGDGGFWLPVELPGGRRGFAAAEYLTASRSPVVANRQRDLLAARDEREPDLPVPRVADRGY